MKHKITKIFCAAGIFFSSIILLYGYFLNNILTDIAIPDNILYGKTFYILKNNAFIDFPLLKVNAYSAHNPDIITIGSSRVTQFREAFFTRSFVNMGYSVGSIGDMGRLYQILRERERERESLHSFSLPSISGGFPTAMMMRFWVILLAGTLLSSICRFFPRSGNA